ncbi:MULTISPECIES: TetR/AcrR family transcriptional regulator [Streptomyces]|uniref:TetR/AcrR family transcriptional regulator n=1 Tax=Streptomyces odorifer TaxID=53450 RepID=A0A7Y6CA99_9ACTN|nr:MULTISPECIES: TetR/AcrR family transcriptional regulator [Streptomyces albidoflavus group]NUV36292.1 TetR/AcrR family transcriptional regulator [Streptomyces sp. KAI-27]NUV49734.1 TetR/AcrR family transcriptional regulator [Streptomyces sp. CAI-78]MCR0988394.1 TetR/AcrR family transcriptional regulator [Streptomyces albidoflavus]NUV29912.1 TetR/AcrR family transcriptional regulator [Streptomyces odorifer]QDD59530.1 TetR/AcrR family transcriptional regulator [Streptomyces albidoflavus]
MTSEQAERTYHHGDLRRAVLAAAEEVIRAEGPQALSLRDLARRAGVSHAAPAHHFKDRTGLLTAFAAEGWTLFAAALQAAPDLRERGVAYVRFAREHPAHFQVMFQPALLRTEDPALRAATAAAGEALRAGVAGAPGADATRPRLAGVAAWSLAHGFASLLLSDNLDEALEGRAPEEAFREIAGLLFGREGGRTVEP